MCALLSIIFLFLLSYSYYCYYCYYYYYYYYHYHHHHHQNIPPPKESIWGVLSRRRDTTTLSGGSYLLVHRFGELMDTSRITW